LPPHIRRQPILPLPSVHVQTTASAYVNLDPIPAFSAHTCADTLFDSINYQNIFANLSLPHTRVPPNVNVPTHTNVPTHAIPLGQSNVTDVPNLYAASHASDVDSSSLVAIQPTVCTSYADISQRLPIVVERPIAVDSTVQYVVSTSATADYVRPTVTAHAAPLQSPSIHWRKRFAYDYIQPDTGLGAPTRAAPAIHSGNIRPQTSDTHTHIHTRI